MKKLIICDMSGIASTRGVNNDELLNVLNNMINYDSSFCTGKGYCGGYQTIKNIDMKVPFICENGSLIVDKQGNIKFCDHMNPADVKELIETIAKECNFEFLAYIDTKTHRYKFLKGNKNLTEDLTQPWFYSEEIYENVNEFLENIDLNNVCRITTRGLDFDEGLEIFKKFHVVVSEGEFHSICNIGTNKGFGVKKLAEICNIDIKDIVIIGNDMNDIDMFKTNCGYKIATGAIMPPQELLDLASIYVPLGELPNFLKKFDKNIKN
ncbi:MAG: HAD family phosphatase [Bacilli bacterium]|nr:HAD family phosphatase [Bacilli bacterium]